MRQADRGALDPAFVDKDMSLLEVNLAAATKGGKLLRLDAKSNFDENCCSGKKTFEVAARRRGGGNR